jgi:SM-20-related protein
MQELLSEGVLVQDGFLSAGRIHELIDCVERRRARGDFQAARIGADGRRQECARIRGDLTCWWTDPLYAEERATLDDFEQLRLKVNREGYLGLFDLEVHYAWYPPGAGYARHVDQLQNRDQRIVSLIVYLNEEWCTEAGGALRIFDAGGDHRDIEPIAGRLVCFLTAGREHAVLPTRRPRLSISGWFRRRAPGGF